jgi:hypothetical protein
MNFAEQTQFHLGPFGFMSFAERTQFRGLSLAHGLAWPKSATTVSLQLRLQCLPNRSDIEEHSLRAFGKASAGGGDEQRLIQSRNYQMPSDWSRDGRSLLYAEIGPGTGLDVWVLPMTLNGKLAPDAKPRPYLRTQFNESSGRFSPEPDPRWVAYASDESGRTEIYVDAFPEACNKVRISTGGGDFPEWSPDGREVFYLAPGLKLMQVSLKRGRDSIEPSSRGSCLRCP